MPMSLFIPNNLILQVIELGRKLGQGSRRASHAGGEGRAPLRQGSFMTSLSRRQSSSGCETKLGLRRQRSSLQLSRYAPLQLEQLLTGHHHHCHND